MALTSFEQVLGFYAVLDKKLEGLSVPDMIFPHNVPTSYTSEKEFLLHTKRQKKEQYLQHKEADYWLGVIDGYDAVSVMRVYHAWRSGDNAARAALDRKADLLRQQASKPAALVFRDLAQELEKSRTTLKSKRVPMTPSAPQLVAMSL